MHSQVNGASTCQTIDTLVVEEAVAAGIDEDRDYH